MKDARVRLTAVEVARACGVDLKTIHNWADKGKLGHTRTEGRHLRFHRLDVVELLRRHAHPVPDALLARRLRVCAAGVPNARRALGRRFDVVDVAETIDAIATLSAIDPDALVLSDEPWMDEAHVIERLHLNESTRHVRIVVACDAVRDAPLVRAGARWVVPREDAGALRDALDKIAFGALTQPTPRS
jgi:excisionase family DNA binding protein